MILTSSIHHMIRMQLYDFLTYLTNVKVRVYTPAKTELL